MKEISALAQVLEAQHTTYAKMLEMEEEKSQALIKGDADSLTKVMSAQQALMVQARGLEAKRMAICAGMKYQTLRELVESSPECREALGPVFSSLSRTVTSLKKKNNRNQKLLEARLTTIRFMKERLGLKENTYSKGMQIRA
jgi:hypothetical protein